MRVAGGNQGGARDTRDGEEDEERVLGDELEDVAVEGVLDGEDETDLLLNRRGEEREDRTKGQRRGPSIDFWIRVVRLWVGGKGVGKRRRGKVSSVLSSNRRASRSSASRRRARRLAMRRGGRGWMGSCHVEMDTSGDGTWGMYAPRDGR